jgi:predicted anti-sigma-YlaC factor YlaD
MLSAQLDGEDDPADRPLLDEHLAGCAGCREWLNRAAMVNRLTWTSVGVAPDLTAAILAALPESPTPALAGPHSAVPVSVPIDASVPGRRPRRRFPLVAALQVALAAVGAVQLMLGLGQIGDGVAGTHLYTGLSATPGHLWHESAAWNVAVGAGYLFIALRRSRPSGLMPMLTAFVGMLLLLSISDLTGDRVDGVRLVSHGFVILGYLLVIALTRTPDGFAAPPGARSAWRAHFTDEPDEPVRQTRPGLRLVPRGPITAEHHERPAA